MNVRFQNKENGIWAVQLQRELQCVDNCNGGNIEKKHHRLNTPPSRSSTLKIKYRLARKIPPLEGKILATK